MSPSPSLNADSRVVPSITGGNPTVDSNKSPQPSPNPSRGGHTADGEDYTGQPSETGVDDRAEEAVALAAQSLKSAFETATKDSDKGTRSWQDRMKTNRSVALESISAVRALDLGLEKVKAALREKHGFSELNAQMAVESAASASMNDKRNERQ